MQPQAILVVQVDERMSEAVIGNTYLYIYIYISINIQLFGYLIGKNNETLIVKIHQDVKTITRAVECIHEIN